MESVYSLLLSCAFESFICVSIKTHEHLFYARGYNAARHYLPRCPGSSSCDHGELYQVSLWQTCDWVC